MTAGLLLAACGSSAPPANLISVSNGGCGGSWHVARPGPYTFQIYIAAAEEGDIDLVNPASGAIYAEVEMLGPGTTSPLRLDMGSGQYAFRCSFEDFDPFNGPTETVGGHTGGNPGIVPVTQDDLLQPAKEYTAYVSKGLVTLATETGTLLGDVRAGNLTQAKAAWLTAHLQYERLGAAYDAFGDFDDEIDGRPDGLAGGVNSAQWTGFYRLEYGLWHGQSERTLTTVATTLDKDVLALAEGRAGPTGRACRSSCSTSACVPTRSWRTPWSSSSAAMTTTAAAARWPPRSPTSPVTRNCSASCVRCWFRDTRNCPTSTPGWTAFSRCSINTAIRTDSGLP